MKTKNKELYKDIEENYENLPAQYFVDKYNVALQTVYCVASKLKVSSSQRWDTYKTDIINDYLIGLSLDELAIKYGHDTTNIKKFLVKNGVKMKTQSDWNQHYSFDKSFFKKIDSHVKAYWLGFIYADGNLYNSALQIGLGIKDKEHLNLFKKDIKSTHQIYTDGDDGVKIIIRNEELFADLKNLELCERKSLILRFPSEKTVTEQYKNSFMLGYFDGDGTIGLNKNTKKWRFGITSTYEFCLEFKNALMGYTKILHMGIYKEKRSVGNTWNLSIGGGCTKTESKWRIQEIYNFLYKDCETFLERKKEKFIQTLSC